VVAAVFFAALTGAVAVYFFLVRDRLNGEPTTGGDFSAEKRAALQQQFDDAGRIPALESLSPAANPVAANASTTIEAAVRNPDNLPYYLFWTASCGVVAQIPEQRTRAVFLAPPAGGPCRVTVELRSENAEDQEPGA
jgi:hypothetical protein